MQCRSSAKRRKVLLCTVIWLLLAWCGVAQPGEAAIQKPAATPRDNDYDNTVILQMENPNMPVSTWARQVSKDVVGCELLPIPGKGWVVCQLAPPEVTPASAQAESDRIAGILSRLESMGLPSGGATVGSAGTQQRLFREVGRGIKFRLTLPIQDNTAPATAAAAATAQPNTIGTRQAVVSFPEECPDGTCPQLWNFNRVKVSEMWAQMGSEMPFPQISRKISFIDTGADVMNNNIKDQFDVTNSITFTADSQRSPASEGGKAGQSTHGSHVFGTAAAAWNGGDPTGVAGVMGPAASSAVSCNIFGDNGDVSTASISDIIKCTAHVLEVNSHWVVNLSVGAWLRRNSTNVKLMKAAFNDNVCSQNGLIIVAADNQSADIDGPYQYSDDAKYPAAFAGDDVPCLIAVASIDQDDQLSAFSNYGTRVKIAAPGGAWIRSSSNSRNGQNPWAIDLKRGTSMATPLVTGTAAVLMNAFPKATNTQVMQCLLSTATDPVKYNNFLDPVTIGGGILNALAAYECMLAIFPAGGACKDGIVPPCVDSSSGVFDNSCTASNTTYCLPVEGNQTCSYSFVKRGTVCNTTTAARCSGSRPTCPNRVTNTTCVSAMMQCELPGLCVAADGCKCPTTSRAAAGRRQTGLSCICAAERGFAPIQLKDGGYRCRWMLNFAGLRFINLPLYSSRAVLPIPLKPAGTCPPAGTKVVQSVTVTTAVDCPTRPQNELQGTTDELGETCGKYVMSTQLQGLANGCYNLIVATTDRRSYNLVLYWDGQ